MTKYDENVTFYTKMWRKYDYFEENVTKYDENVTVWLR